MEFLVRTLGALVATFLLLIVEIVLTMLVYTGLNLYSLELFGHLVRLSSGVLGLAAALVEKLFAGSVNSAYATLFGELGPKSMLLLLIGLVVASVIRLAAQAMRAMGRPA